MSERVRAWLGVGAVAVCVAAGCGKATSSAPLGAAAEPDAGDTGQGASSQATSGSGGFSGTAVDRGGSPSQGGIGLQGGGAGSDGAAGADGLELLGTKKNDFGAAFIDAFLLFPCYEVSAHDCLTIPAGETCPNSDAPELEDRGVVLRESFDIGGELGEVYSAHLVVNGIIEGKYYEGGLRDGGHETPSDNHPGADTFYRGGRPLESRYNVYKISVRDADGNPYAHYYLNSFTQASGAEAHLTFRIAYEKDIDVPGGGTIEYMTQDPNCRAIDNCGSSDNSCSPRNIPNEPGLSLPQNWGGRPLASWNLVNGGLQPFHASLVHVRVTKFLRK